MNSKDVLKESISTILRDVGIDDAVAFTVERPVEFSHGDYSTNVALITAKVVARAPYEFAEELVEKIKKNLPTEVERVEVAGPGFINFFLTPEHYHKSVDYIRSQKDTFGKSGVLAGKKILIEHTSPNAFKLLHIGHFMANTIGEAISRLTEWGGAEVKRATYASDIGLPVAKAIWGMIQLNEEMPTEAGALDRKVEFLGNAYVHGATSFEENESIQTEIKQINASIYKKSNEEINNLYAMGRRWSLEYLEYMYHKLGTSFDFYFFESEVFEEGVRLVREHQAKVFRESEGAVVFKGEDFGLHTRVFITSAGHPTYETKELGLHKAKSELYPFDRSIVVTGGEQQGVMQVGLKAFEQIDASSAQKTVSITHGLMLGGNGKKMSSRKGETSSAEGLITIVADAVKEKMKGRDIPEEMKGGVAESVAIGALKYQILKQSPEKNVIFDIEKALSFEGDSGPYLQYAVVRAGSVLEKAKREGVVANTDKKPVEVGEVEKLLERFPDVLERATNEYAPQYVTTYLTAVASAFNAFYAQQKIVDSGDVFSPYNVALTEAVKIVLLNGLEVLGILVPEKM